MSDAIPPTDKKDRGPLLALLTANVISQIGNTMAMLAIPWFVLTTTGSASSTAITVAVGTLPVVISGVFGGAIVDRLGYKPSSIVSDLASGTTMILIPILHGTIGISLGQLLVLVFLGALLDAPGSSARRSLYPELAGRAGITLERANAGYSMSNRLASMLAAPAGGIIIAVLGAPNLLYLDAATFFVSAGIVATRVPSAIDVPSEQTSGGIRRYLRDVREGFLFLHRDRILSWLVISFAAGSLLAEPVYGVILPVYTQERYGDAVNLGLIFGALAIGSLIGNVIYATLSHRITRRRMFLGGFLVRGLAFTVLVFVPPWWVIALAIFVGAIALEPINPLSMTMMQERVPPGMRGRAFSAGAAVQACALPIGLVVYGSLLDGIGTSATLALFVVVNLAFPAWLCVVPALRSLDDQPA
ncbi:MAG: hypothetical protein AVDCRST_MAG43-1837 [uncultured Thermomicrobiales bacterium]|uniref:Major facilitator superfamily (MFS) profile domain-containing protein n=1 Tax=uncultured Thermomicrobiales bacterium TaxID=1645740 RepID=A0A6J4UYB3_9BACT|nr:MAG: hypothetical protein AVDCRST_MAG43-1837 [uncultured Thermomicrobiales bacterium]